VARWEYDPRGSREERLIRCFNAWGLELVRRRGHNKASDKVHHIGVVHMFKPGKFDTRPTHLGREDLWFYWSGVRLQASGERIK
jgi:hypothetical protein